MTPVSRRILRLVVATRLWRVEMSPSARLAASAVFFINDQPSTMKERCHPERSRGISHFAQDNEVDLVHAQRGRMPLLCPLYQQSTSN
jgi:hypothetical protein